MSVYVIPEHQTSYFTCDFIGGKPEHRSACRAGVSVRRVCSACPLATWCVSRQEDAADSVAS